MKKTANYVRKEMITIVKSHAEALANTSLTLMAQLRDYLDPVKSQMTWGVAKMFLLEMACDTTVDESIRKDISKKIKIIGDISLQLEDYEKMLTEMRQV